tara:strand:- start:4677 stop:4877 length:201 start_codon:yes stop_codon:yes gene_type:complete
MTENRPFYEKAEPKLGQRKCGGWFAVSPYGVPFQIGVTRETEIEAKERFGCALRKWNENLHSLDGD